MTFSATIIAKITTSQYILLDICHTEFYPHRTKKKKVELIDALKSSMSFTIPIFTNSEMLNSHHHHHHKHQGLDPLIRSVSRVIVALSNVF